MLAQFPIETPTGFGRVWKPIETILRTGADVFSQIAPHVMGKTPYPITPTGAYQPPSVVRGPLRQAIQPLNLGLPLLALGGILIFASMRKRR